MPPQFSTLAAALAILGFTGSGSAAPLAEKIDQLAAPYVDSGQVPGVILGISTPGAGVLIVKRGSADLSTGAPMERANSQRIGSITKSFTVTRILQLADERRLSLDDPISKYVSGLRNGDATLRELADMTSGIFNYTEDQAFILDFAFHRTKKWTDQQIVDVGNRNRPYFAPGTHWHYSNTNTVLLGMVVQRVTGNPLRVELTRHIIRPLDLTHTIYPTGTLLPAPYTHGYATLDTDQGRIDVTRLSPTSSAGSGAMISTLDDLFRWGPALARGALLSRRSQFARLQMFDSANGVGPFYDRYGLGLGRIDGWLGHTADIFGYQSLVMHNLVTGQTVVIFVNASNHDHIPTELFQKITPLLPAAVPARAPELRLTGRRHRATNADSIRIRGRAASDAGGILLVQFKQGGAFHRLARGTRAWNFRADLQPGRNVIAIRAVDRLGRKSRVARVIVTRL
jgi:CubicO group peptidase (beta-lactamase class C family)